MKSKIAGFILKNREKIVRIISVLLLLSVMVWLSFQIWPFVESLKDEAS